MHVKSRYILIAVLAVAVIMVAGWSMPLLQTGSNPETVYAANSIEKQQAVSNDGPVYATASSTGNEVENRTGASLSDETDEMLPMDEALADKKAMIERVAMLVAKQEAELLGQAGWVHYSERVYSLTKLRGNGPPELPMSELYPEDVSFTVNWVRIDENDLVHERLTFVKSPDGLIRQLVILYDGRSVNQTLRDAGLSHYEQRRSLEPVSLPARQALHMLEQIVSSERSSVTASLAENMEYIVIAEHRQAEPVTDDPRFLGQSVLGAKWEFVFDWETGQLLSWEISFLVDDRWVIEQTIDSIQVEFRADLPGDVAKLFADSVNSIREQDE
jgi:hypothetical protein